MNKDNTLDAIRGASFFSDMDDEHLQRLAEIAELVDLPPHSTIFKENDPAENVYVVASGHVSLVICMHEVGCRQLSDVGDGEMLGWSPLVGRSRMSDTARTATAATLISINGEQLLDLCRKQPDFGFAFMYRAAQVLAQRLGAVRVQLMDMTGHSLPEVVLESD
ncbi:MAG: Crp/Fnr family transcriptional regulator [Pirellulales bacterium]|nr:Crp/Fnr family transcriptional regulator [Planctomycetales bacterium]